LKYIAKIINILEQGLAALSQPQGVMISLECAEEILGMSEYFNWIPAMDVLKEAIAKAKANEKAVV